MEKRKPLEDDGMTGSRDYTTKKLRFPVQFWGPLLTFENDFIA